MTPRPLRWSLLALAAMMLLPAVPAGAGVIPNDEHELRTLISIVARKGDTRRMEELLAAGMDINLQDSDGQPALVTATLAQQNDMVRPAARPQGRCRGADQQGHDRPARRRLCR